MSNANKTIAAYDEIERVAAHDRLLARNA